MKEIFLLLVFALSIAYFHYQSDAILLAVVLSSILAFHSTKPHIGVMAFGTTFVLASLFYFWGATGGAIKISILSFAFLVSALLTTLVRHAHFQIDSRQRKENL